jgi:hypothetical protein
MPEPLAVESPWTAYQHALHGDRAVQAGDLDAAYACYEASLAAFDRIGDGLGRSIPLRALAALAILDADYAAAQVLLEESLTALAPKPAQRSDAHDLAVQLSHQALALLAAKQHPSPVDALAA